MKMSKKMQVKIVVIFAVLSAVGVGMVAIPLEYATGTAATALPIMGGAIFAASLAFFLVEMFQFNQA
jgi:hypothetical protein